MQEKFEEKIFSIQSEAEFDALALEIFCFQSESNSVYKNYLSKLKINASQIEAVSQIPFLPIEFFRTHEVISKLQTLSAEQAGSNLKLQTFSSSGTTGRETSKHIVQNISVYEKSFRKAFKIFYGSVSDYCVLALLPSYLEREGSSLVYMVNDLIRKSGNTMSGFYLHNFDELASTLKLLQEQKQKTILFGVTYALLDFSERHKLNFPELLVMETGGMKGNRREMVREELHKILCEHFGVKKIHSEYGMTELLTQAYSKGDGIFKSPAWMKIYIRDVNDPMSFLEPNKTGGINVIDLANMYSCSFIATQDLGKFKDDGFFEMLGRFDSSDLRGCNLMVS